MRIRTYASDLMGRKELVPEGRDAPAWAVRLRTHAWLDKGDVTPFPGAFPVTRMRLRLDLRDFPEAAEERCAYRIAKARAEVEDEALRSRCDCVIDVFLPS